jgi:hypothetical protein
MRQAIILFLVIMLLAFSLSWADELPVPSLHNAVIISIEHPVTDYPEVEYIKNNFNFGLYTWLSFSKTAFGPELSWHASWDEAGQGIQSFKQQVNQYIHSAGQENVRLHIVLCSGLVRILPIYREAKEEDIRNCQWYQDNKLASDTQIAEPKMMDQVVFGTLSRYARKLRRNLEAKSCAALDFLKTKIDEYPGIVAAVSGWGEAELNFNRINHSQSYQDHFCDFSPFAVLEFRDWIQHAGMYDDADGRYAGQGYAEGGNKYQGSSGLQQFNQDFGTAFSSWDLKYFHWSLDDDYDIDPADNINHDPGRIDYSDYVHGGMMPQSGSHFTAGGFDPPREMKPDDDFWELWNFFRETMVHNYVKDMAKWAAAAGIPAERWYSHQIPADYLFGTNPESPNKNARYYTSASPLWSADIEPYGSVGATIYDIKFPQYFARTTQHALDAVEKMSGRWAIMEYDAETYPPGLDVPQSSENKILEQFMEVYNHRPHLINFFRWQDNNREHRIKGMNKETALKNFIQRIRDKARSTNLSVVYDPPRMTTISGEQDAGLNRLEFSEKIWPDQKWKWTDWGDFSHFAVYRGEEQDFPEDKAHLLAETADAVYEDADIPEGKIFYYRVKAVNTEGVEGDASLTLKLPRDIVYTLHLKTEEGGSTDPQPGMYGLDSGVEVEITALPQNGYFFNGWSGDAGGEENPLNLVMDQDKSITATFFKDILDPPLNFTGEQFMEASLVQRQVVNYLTWEANPLNQNVEKYRIYEKAAGEEIMLAEVDAETYEYLRRGVDNEKEYIYALTAVNSRETEGERTITVIR